MAKNGKSGDNRRHGAVKNRTQTKNTKNGLWIKRDSATGKFMDVKTTGGKFKGITKEE